MKNSILKFCAFLLLTLSLFSCGYEKIDAGYEGIKIPLYGDDKGDGIALVSGAVWYNPWSYDVEELPAYVLTQDYPAFTVNSKDGSEFAVDPTISLRLIRGNGPKVWAKYRQPLEQVLSTSVYNTTRDAFRIQFNRYTVDEITGKREEFEANVQKYLINQLTTEGFNLEQLTSGIKYPDAIVASINAKNESVQRALKVENDIRVNEGLNKIKLMNAQTEKQVNELKTESLNSLVIQQLFIEKWDGKTPLYGSAPTMFKNVN